jgi:Sec-independent protein secretion pathway component TatC
MYFLYEGGILMARVLARSHSPEAQTKTEQ